MIVSIKLAIQPASLYTEELSNFLGTQAALMQSGVVINRAHGRVVAQKPEVGMHPVALKVTVLPKTTIFVLAGYGQRCGLHAGLPAGLHGGVYRPEEGDADADVRHDGGRLDGAGHAAGEGFAARRRRSWLGSRAPTAWCCPRSRATACGNYLAALYQRLAAQKSEYELLQMLTLDQNIARQQLAGGALVVDDPLPTQSPASAPNAGDAAGTASKTTDQPSGPSADRADVDYLRAQQQLLLMKAEQEQLGRDLRTNHPKMIAMKEEIARREELLRIFRGQSEDQLKNRKEMLALEIQILEKDLKEWDARSLELQQKAAEYQRLKGNVQRIQALYDQLLATMQTLDVNKEISPESVEIMEKASPGFPDRANLWQKLGLGGLLGLALWALGC